MFRLIKIGEPVGDAAPETLIVVCDSDAEKAAQYANALEDRRTAVFVGDLDDAMTRQAAEAFGGELSRNPSD